MIQYRFLLLLTALSDADIQEVIVIGAPAQQTQTAVLDQETIVDVDPIDWFGAMSLLPSIAPRINSRGEAQFYARGAGERETAVFWQGLPLMVPYDNRFDFALLPALGIQRISIQYGPTAFSKAARSAAASIEVTNGADPSLVTASLGTGHFRSLGLLTALENTTVTLAYQGRDYQTLARPLPYSQAPNGGRTNTDQDLASLAVTSTLKAGAHDISLSLLSSMGERGIAPQSNRDPDISRVRYWRYPDSRYLLAGARLSNENETIFYGATLWGQIFDQTIQSFTDDSYTDLSDQQADKNVSLGLRAQGALSTDRLRLTLGLNSHITRHEERQNNVQTGALQEDQFTETNLSPSFAMDVQLGKTTTLTGHVGVDWTVPKDRANRAGRGSFLSEFWSLAVQKTAPWGILSLRTGEKTRAPTLREQYGTALGRFQPNPDLQGEHSWSTEAVVELLDDHYSVRMTGFSRRVKKGLEQILIPQADGPGLLQRVNGTGYRILGLEAVIRAQLSDSISIQADLTHMDAKRTEPRAIPASDGNRYAVAERPAWLGQIALSFRPRSRLLVRLDSQWIGGSYSLDGAGSLTRQGGGFTHGGRISYPLTIKGRELVAFARLDNIFDTEITPQAGLPLPGRNIRVGLRVFL